MGGYQPCRWGRANAPRRMKGKEECMSRQSCDASFSHSGCLLFGLLLSFSCINVSSITSWHCSPDLPGMYACDSAPQPFSFPPVQLRLFRLLVPSPVHLMASAMTPCTGACQMAAMPRIQTAQSGRSSSAPWSRWAATAPWCSWAAAAPWCSWAPSGCSC